jgi:hypothetical protein
LNSAAYEVPPTTKTNRNTSIDRFISIASE